MTDVGAGLQIVAILPLRSLTGGKRRLADTLDAAQHQKLVRMLCEQAVGALRKSGVVYAIALVSGDEAALGFAEELGLVAIEELEPGLNTALRTAGGWARETGADAQMIVLPDLPLLRPTDLHGILRAARPGEGIVACPDRHGRGTNILLLRPCAAIEPAFGADSFQRHLTAARSAGLPAATYTSEGTSWDVDTPDDLEALGLQF